VLAYDPVLQSLQAFSSSFPGLGEYLPGKQLWHWAELFNAILVENVPASHSEHILLPSIALYFPTSHGLHAKELLAPWMLRYVPKGHILHDDSPALFEYIPTLQLAHEILELDPVLFENVPGKHRAQVEFPVAWILEEYVPLEQDMQSEAFSWSEYFPWLHKRHSVDP
jgi:hypothetical protein